MTHVMRFDSYGTVDEWVYELISCCESCQLLCELTINDSSWIQESLAIRVFKRTHPPVSTHPSKKARFTRRQEKPVVEYLIVYMYWVLDCIHIYIWSSPLTYYISSYSTWLYLWHPIYHFTVLDCIHIYMIQYNMMTYSRIVVIYPQGNYMYSTINQ